MGDVVAGDEGREEQTEGCADPLPRPGRLERPVDMAETDAEQQQAHVDYVVEQHRAEAHRLLGYVQTIPEIFMMLYNNLFHVAHATLY